MKDYKRFVEELMYLTVRIKSTNGIGTGFFYEVLTDSGVKCPILITNRHVINDNINEEVTINFHLHQGKHNAKESREFKIKTTWFMHNSLDICFCFIDPVNECIKNETKTFIEYKQINRDYIINNDEINGYAPLDELVMVGYPLGLYNAKYNLPIFRKGYIASHPSVDFAGNKEGIVDMACFPGSSGSPIFIYSNGLRRTIDNSLALLEQYKLLGILRAIPIYNKKGEICVENIPTTITATFNIETMTNLGYYIKSIVINDIENIVNQIIKTQNKINVEIKII